ncbi:hypothetical protein Agub_g993, partial [Astrephomene gubernaculifera]
MLHAMQAGVASGSGLSASLVGQLAPLRRVPPLSWSLSGRRNCQSTTCPCLTGCNHRHVCGHLKAYKGCLAIKCLEHQQLPQRRPRRERLPLSPSTSHAQLPWPSSRYHLSATPSRSTSSTQQHYRPRKLRSRGGGSEVEDDPSEPLHHILRPSVLLVPSSTSSTSSWVPQDCMASADGFPSGAPLAVLHVVQPISTAATALLSYESQLEQLIAAADTVQAVSHLLAGGQLRHPVQIPLQQQQQQPPHATSPPPPAQPPGSPRHPHRHQDGSHGAAAGPHHRPWSQRLLLLACDRVAHLVESAGGGGGRTTPHRTPAPVPAGGGNAGDRGGEELLALASLRCEVLRSAAAGLLDARGYGRVAEVMR